MLRGKPRSKPKPKPGSKPILIVVGGPNGLWSTPKSIQIPKGLYDRLSPALQDSLRNIPSSTQ